MITKLWKWFWSPTIFLGSYPCGRWIRWDYFLGGIQYIRGVYEHAPFLFHDVP